MKSDHAIMLMRQRAANLTIESARLSGVMRAIRDMGGIDVLRAITAAELERLTLNANDNADWIG